MSKVCPAPWLAEPAPRNSSALKKAWVNRWKTAAVQAPTPRPMTMYPSMADRRVRQDSLDVVLHDSDRRREQPDAGAARRVVEAHEGLEDALAPLLGDARPHRR